MQLRSGSSTSEFRLTVAAILVGVACEAGAGALHSLQEQGFDKPWFAMALAIMGAMLQMAALFGYQKARTVVKVAALEANVAAGPSPTPPERPSASP